MPQVPEQRHVVPRDGSGSIGNNTGIDQTSIPQNPASSADVLGDPSDHPGVFHLQS